jgi:translation initiation factor IF-1
MNLKSFNTLTIEELAKVLKALPELKKWIDNVEEYALEQVENGVTVPGYELGRTRSQRVWIDEDDVADMLIEQSYDIDNVMPRELLSVAQMEKLLGKDKFASLCSSQVGEKLGMPKLVPIKKDVVQ